MKRTMTALMICSVVFILAACSNSNQKTISEVEQEQAELEEMQANELQASEFDGTITKTGSGLSLKTGAGEFIIEGQDLNNMVGKKVKVYGALVESDSGKKINITAVTPIE